MGERRKVRNCAGEGRRKDERRKDGHSKRGTFISTWREAAGAGVGAAADAIHSARRRRRAKPGFRLHKERDRRSRGVVCAEQKEGEKDG